MKFRHFIDIDKCKGCGLCVIVCPKKNLKLSEELNKKGYYSALQKNPENCLFCTSCCIMCPDVAITITESAEEETE